MLSMWLNMLSCSAPASSTSVNSASTATVVSSCSRASAWRAGRHGPVRQDTLGLDDAQLGIVLLCMGLGSAGDAAGRLPTHRFGNRRVLTISGVLLLRLTAIAGGGAVGDRAGAALTFFGAAWCHRRCDEMRTQSTSRSCNAVRL